MSIFAVGWAMKRPVKRSSEKFVLVCLANYANENGVAFPSIAALESDTSQNRKTVIRSLQSLVEDGWIVDTGKRTGVTKQIPVYQIQFENTSGGPTPDNSPKNGTVKPSQETANSTENGTVQESEQSRFSVQTVPFFPGNSTVFPHKQSQKRDTEPSGTIKEPSRNLEERAKRRTRLPHASLPDDWRSRCVVSHPTLSASDEFEKFSDHHTAAGSAMADWAAAWRTWLRNAERFAARDRPRAGPQLVRPTANQQMQQNVIGALSGYSNRRTIDVEATEVGPEFFAPRIAR